MQAIKTAPKHDPAAWRRASRPRRARREPHQGRPLRVRYDASGPRQPNLYGYVLGDPVNGFDPTGEFLPAALALGVLCAGGGCEILVAAIAGTLTGLATVLIAEEVLDRVERSPIQPVPIPAPSQPAQPTDCEPDPRDPCLAIYLACQTGCVGALTEAALMQGDPSNSACFFGCSMSYNACKAGFVQ